MRSGRTALLLLAGLLLPGAVGAQTADPSWLWFPGELRNPSSAASAGVALCDRWLAEAPFDNPATPARNQGAVTPLLLRVTREDLRAGNRNVDETPAFIDGGGAWAGAKLGGLEVFGYADQPVLRLEASAFTSGTGLGPAAGSPASVALDLQSREVRAGAGASVGSDHWRVGAAVEWSQLKDRTQVTIHSGSPTGNGTATTELKGSGVGAQVGARVAFDVLRPSGLVIGASARKLPKLEIRGDTLSIERSSGWEGGFSARAQASEALAVLAGAGGAGGLAWDGLGQNTGPSSTWGVGFEYHDPTEPWTARFGLGQERQDHVAESRAGRFALGFGWDFGGSTLDVAAMRRNLEREGKPDAYDDRVAATLRFTW